MKKIIIASGIVCLLASFSANAQISIQAIFGEPGPAYVEAPEYYEPAYPVYPTYAVESSRYHERFRNDRRGHQQYHRQERQNDDHGWRNDRDHR